MPLSHLLYNFIHDFYSTSLGVCRFLDLTKHTHKYLIGTLPIYYADKLLFQNRKSTQESKSKLES